MARDSSFSRDSQSRNGEPARLPLPTWVSEPILDTSSARTAVATLWDTLRILAKTLERSTKSVSTEPTLGKFAQFRFKFTGDQGPETNMA